MTHIQKQTWPESKYNQRLHPASSETLRLQPSHPLQPNRQQNCWLLHSAPEATFLSPPSLLPSQPIHHLYPGLLQWPPNWSLDSSLPPTPSSLFSLARMIPLKPVRLHHPRIRTLPISLRVKAKLLQKPTGPYKIHISLSPFLASLTASPIVSQRPASLFPETTRNTPTEIRALHFLFRKPGPVVLRISTPSHPSRLTPSPPSRLPQPPYSKLGSAPTTGRPHPS